jgi:hypothetical protein
LYLASPGSIDYETAAFLDMTTKRSWLKEIVKSVFGGVMQIGGQARSIALSPRRRIFPKWFFWVKFTVLLAIAGALFMYIILFILAYAFTWIMSGRILISSNRKEVVHVHQVAVDGRRVLMDKSKRITKGLGSELFINLDYRFMQSNTTHRILVRASSASAPVAKDYTCAIFIPPGWGNVNIYFENQNDISCIFREEAF